MKTIRQLLVDAGLADAAVLVMDLFEEYEAAQTPESIVVHDLDKFDMVVQADTYQTQDPTKDLSSFFSSTLNGFRSDFIQRHDAFIRANNKD
jgi:putative hydrolase of HD superfamily